MLSSTAASSSSLFRMPRFAAIGGNVIRPILRHEPFAKPIHSCGQ
jgi:hypothetical protein